MKKILYSFFLSFLLSLCVSTNTIAQDEVSPPNQPAKQLATAATTVNPDGILHDGGADFIINNTENGSFIFQASGIDVLSIQETGRVIFVKGLDAYNILIDARGHMQFQPNGISGDEITMTLTDDTRYVGIGTTTPSQLLTISEDNAPTFRMERSGATRFDFEMYMNSADLRFRGGADGTGGALTDFVTFSSTGNVGIGTTTPSQLLTVSEDNAPTFRMERSGVNRFDYEMYMNSADLRFRGGADGTGGTLTDFVTFSSTGNVGIGTINPDRKLHVNGKTKIEVARSTFDATTFNSALDLQMTGTTSSLGGIILRYSDVSNAGAAIFAKDDVFGGIEVLRTNGSAFAPIDASAFNVESDRRLKKDIKVIDSKNNSQYMNQIRKIESASFWYKREAKRERPVPHIGVIAQSLPQELQVTMNERADGSSAKRLGVGLSDWLGLVTIGVKENDQRVQQIAKDHSKLKEENELLKEKVESLESKITTLSTMVEKLLNQKGENPIYDNYELQLKKVPLLKQNQPNPFNENTLIEYFLPETIKNAYIQVTTIEGKVLAKVNIQKKGKGQVTIKAAAYPAGTYHYSLVVDGEVFETKQMVLTR